MPVRTAYVATEAVGDVLTKANFDKLPGGWIGYAEITSPQASITTVVDVTGLTVTVTANATRRLRVTAEIRIFSSVANDVCGVLITDASNVIQGEGHLVTVTNAVASVIHASVVLTPAAGSYTFKVRAQRSSGTGTVTVYGSATNKSYILVEDLGPAS